MKCIECGSAMERRRGQHRAKDLGLPQVILCNIEIRRCLECGEEEIVIPRLEELTHALAGLLIRKPNRLAGEEIRFLRKSLGWSGAAFASKAGVERETVSRWENGHEKIGAVADRFLRLAVAHWQPVKDYEQTSLDTIKRKTDKPLNLRVRCARHGWQPARCG